MLALSTRLSMTALGVLGDRPPVAVQPPLVDGIHLRWSFTRSTGFPWYGYFLYRRPNADLERTCLASGFIDLVTDPLSTTGTIGADELSSDLPLVGTDDFPANGQAELDLGPFDDRGRTYVRLDVHDGEVTVRVSGRVGFRSVGTKLICSELDSQPKGVRITPEPVPGVGVRLDAGARIRLDPPCDQVRLAFSGLGQGVSAVARDASGHQVADGDTKGRPSLTLTTTTQPIVGVEVRQHAHGDAPVVLRELCRRPSARGTRSVVLTGSRSGVPVASTTITGRPGEIVPFDITADAMDEVRFTGQDGDPLPDAALIELCYVPLLLTAALRWEPLLPGALPLPVTHPDYPASGGRAEDETAARAEADGRIRYPAPDTYGAPEFHDLHDALIDLVTGGPGGVPMADPSRAADVTAASGSTTGDGLPTMPAQHPLDLVLLPTIHPAMAQLLGLYWVDDTAVPRTAYDYLLLADNAGVSGGDPAKALAAWEQSDPGVDAAIVTDEVAGPATPLAAPRDVRAYALTGGTLPAGEDPSVVIALAGSVGLRWQLPESGGALSPGSAVAYHVWRDELGDATDPAPGSGLGDQLTAAGPVVVADPDLDPFHPIQWPPHWPGKALYRVDPVTAEGWYGYRVAGMDVFGRISPPSDPAAWYQWAPMPSPRPWYYVDPAAESLIRPGAVRIRDTVPPPPPSAVEATVLDPADPFLLRDTAYTAWRGQVDAELIGLRVSWKWTAAQRQQAPGTAEFRVYWSADQPAPDTHDPLAYTDRVHVVPISGGVDGAGDLSFEVFLPVPGGTVFTGGVPLAPTLADPVKYAYVAVSAADANPHTADAATWPDWGDRAGNEGRAGGPAKVFRVRRDAPPAPAVPADSERVYATPADYLSASYYTYRWVPGTNLTTHVYRALDESVFAADWRARPRPPLAATDTAQFPDPVAEPRWNSAKRAQVAAELNGLNAFPQTSTGKAQAMAAYRALSDDGLRVLAGLAGTERAFTQITTAALDPASPDTANRVGPDNPPDFPVDPALRCYVDTLDGRSTNRYFYRSSYVDAARNTGPLSSAGPPVWLPKVAAPRTPSLRSVTGGETLVTIAWAANRETDLAEYLVYRADTEAAARDVRAMTLVHTEPVGDRPPRVVWTDAPVPAQTTLWYRLAAADTSGNVSPPTDAMPARAYRSAPPPAPEWVAADRAAPDTTVHLVWTLAEPRLRPLVQRRPDGVLTWVAVSGWLTEETTSFDDATADAGGYFYRVLVRDPAGNVPFTAPARYVPPFGP